MKALIITICLFLIGIDAYSCESLSDMSSKNIHELELCIDKLDEVLIRVDLAIQKGEDLKEHLDAKDVLDEARVEFVAELEQRLARIKYKKQKGKCAKESASAKNEYSAKIIFENIGPFKKVNSRSLFKTSLPKMSEGIKSGVNCILLKFNPRTSDTVLTNKVLARPGTPIKRE